MNCPAEKLFKP